MVQEVEKTNVEVSYPLMEHFYTLQGEGYWAGHAAYFLRLGGCDVGCHWCDVKESWDVEAHPKVTVAEMLAAIQATPARIVVVTGGEPMMHDLGPLTAALKAAGLRTHVETSGAHPLTGTWDWVTFSPKKFKAPLTDFYPAADELKVIVYTAHDLAWAETHTPNLKPSAQLYLQPEWSRPESAQWIIDYVKANPQWRISLQTHKFLEIP
jgi:7-carboxy-7-deazaguanine synthase